MVASSNHLRPWQNQEAMTAMKHPDLFATEMREVHLNAALGAAREIYE